VVKVVDVEEAIVLLFLRRPYICTCLRACADVEVHIDCRSTNASSTSFFHLKLKCTQAEKKPCTHVGSNDFEKSVLPTVFENR